MILSLLLYSFLAYMLYRLIFHFIIPIVRTTRRVKKTFRQMQEQMNGPYNQQAAGNYGYGQQATTGSAAKKDDEDYIEFEEVK
jgi:hypothetical protein